eukprot:3940481-Rhodomonas_salina.10
MVHFVPTEEAEEPQEVLAPYPTSLRAATPCPVLTWCTVLSAYAVSGTDMARAAISLRLRFAVSCTDPACAAISLRVRYAMSGTDLVCSAISLRMRYAVSSTDRAHADISIRGVRY